jgi:hypothetical protein
MDPIRRLLLLTLVASVLLAEPSQATALLSLRGTPLEREQAIATQRFVRQLAVVLRQTVKPALQGLRKWAQPRVLLADFVRIDSRGARSILLPHLFDLPPPRG